MYPLHISRVYISQSNASIPSAFRERSELTKRVNELTQEIANRTGSEAYLNRLERDNEELRSLLNDEQPERIGARVTARPPYVPYDVIQIDKGREDGILLDAPVFVGKDVVIGFVSHVSKDYAHITLLTTPGQTATAYVLESQIYTTAEGVGNGLLRVRIPQGIETAVNDTVILPAVFSGVFGTIEHIETTPTQPEQYGYVSLQESLQSLRYVAVGSYPLTPQSYSDIESTIDMLRQSLFVVDIPSAATSSEESDPEEAANDSETE